MSIQSVCIEYRFKERWKAGLLRAGDWKLFKYVSVTPDEGCGGELLLLQKAFETYYDFRTVVYATQPLTIRTYDRDAKAWVTS
jgi:hypothetical protein